MDEFGNISTKDVTLHVYAPVPHLQNATLSGSFFGALEEDISGEPIDFVRVREASPLIRFDSMTKSHTGGLFAGTLDKGNVGISIMTSGKKILLDDRGWIGAVPVGYSTIVDGATKATPMKIFLLDASGSSVYSTYMIVPASLTPERMRGPGAETTQTGIVVLPKGDTLWIDALPSDPSFA